MTTSTREDPYYIVKSEIQGQVNELQATYSRWNGLRRTNPERQLLEKEMRQQLTSAEEMLALLRDALASAKRNPEKFNLTRDELSSRDHWISTTSQQVSDVKLGLDKEAAAAAAAASGTSASGSIAPFEEETFNNSNDFIDGQRQLQRHILREQDVYLDRVDQQLVNMQELGRVMHVELDDQASMLENLDAAVDANRSRLGVVMRKTTDVLNRMSMRCQIITIVVLSAAIIGLGVVAFG